MKRQTILKSTLCLIMALVCNVTWAEVLPTEPIKASQNLPTMGIPEYQFYVRGTKSDGQYWKSSTVNTNDVNSAGKFAFYAVPGLADCYYIYSVAEGKWVNYSKDNRNNQKSFVELSENFNAYAYWEIKKATKTGDNTPCYQMRPTQYTKNVGGNLPIQNTYANWFQGVDGSSTMGLYTTGPGGDEGSAWSLVAVDITDDLNAQLARRIALANQVIASVATYEKGTGILTSSNVTDIISSPYTSTQEGSITNLVDGSAGKDNHWHSDYGSQKMNGSHYIVANLGDQTPENLSFMYKRRNSVANDHTTRWAVYGVPADETGVSQDSRAGLTLLAVISTPLTNANDVFENLPPFKTKGFKKFRIYADATNQNRGYFHIGEFQLYGNTLADSNTDDVKALVAALATAESVENANQGDIDALNEKLSVLLASEEDIEAAREALACEGIGYPTANNAQRLALQEVLTGTDICKSSLDAAVTAYKETTDIVLPEDGKAYTFTLVHTDKSEYKIGINGENHLQATTDGDAATFYCHAFTVGNEKRYVFISEQGKILAYQTVTASYTIAGYAANDFIAGAMCGVSSNVTSAKADRFGLIYLTAKARGATIASAGSIIYKPAGGATSFDNSSAPYHDGTFTSAIKAVEVTDYAINDDVALALAKVKAKMQLSGMKFGSYCHIDKEGIICNNLTTVSNGVDKAETPAEVEAFIASRTLNLPTPGKAYYLKDSQGTYLDIHHLVVEANDRDGSTQLASLSKTKQLLYITGDETDGTWKIHTLPEGGKYLHQKPSSRVWNSWVSDAGGDFKWEVEGVDVSGTPHYMLRNISGSENGILGPNNSNHTNAGEPLFVNQQNDAQKLKLQLLPVKSITTEFVPVAAEWLNEECVDVASENVPAGAKFPVEADHADYESYKSSVVTSGEYFYLKKGCLTGVFNWRNNSGNKRVNIVAVEVVDLNDAVVAADYHYGYAGSPSSNNTYTVDVPEDGLYYIRYYAEKKTNGGVNNSDVDITYTYMSKRKDLYNTSKGSLEVPPYRIPGITVDPETGRIITTAARLVCGTDPGYGQVDVVCRISDDHGATWSEMKDVAVGTGITSPEENYFDTAFGDPAVVADRTSNEVLIIAVAGCTVYANGNTTRQNPNLIATIHSTDNGNTWKTPVNVTEAIYSLFDSGTPIQSAFVGGGKIFQSRIVKVGQYYRLYAAMCARPNGNRVIYSDDFGRTWHALGGAAALPAPGGDEPKCEELPDGRVVLSSRVGAGRIYNFYTYSNTTTAEGEWGTSVTSTFEGSGKTHNGQSTNGEILIVPVVRNSDGKDMYLALQSLPTGGGRTNVGIFYKELTDMTDINTVANFAIDWNGFYQVSYTTSAYSSMDLQNDDRIGFIYEENYTKHGVVSNPHSIPFPDADNLGTHNYDGYDNIYVAYPLEIITNNAYSIKSSVDRREFLRSYFTDLTADVVDEVKAAVATNLEGLSTEPTIAEVDGIYFNIGKEDIITAANANKGKVGNYLDAAVDTYKKEVMAATTREAIAAAEAKLTTTTEWNMPVSGKAYTFKNVQKDGTTVRWYKYDTEQGKIVLTATEDEATPFVCRLLENDKYVFVCNDGKYMTWRASVSGYTNGTGVNDAYHGEGRFLTDITIAKMTSGGQIASGVDLSGTRYVSISAKRPDKNETGFVVVKKNSGNPVFDGAGAAYYNDSYSSAFIMEEVAYANTPKLNSVGEGELLSEDLYNTYMATFSAPFPTVFPEGVTAYYATKENATTTEGNVVLNAIAKGEAIPANTGVILVSEEGGNAVMLPAAGETAADVTGNLMGHSAGEAKDMEGVANAYLLTNGEDGVGFYLCSGGTLAANKSYLQLEGEQQAVRIRLAGTTSIDNGQLTMDNESTAIYDLMGRRVQQMGKGMYIVNNKKVIR